MSDTTRVNSKVEVKPMKDSKYGTVEELLQLHMSCFQCGQKLDFIHAVDFGLNITHESSQCTGCGYRSTPVIHRLQ
jgi:C4-type Zn-finger protein